MTRSSPRSETLSFALPGVYHAVRQGQRLMAAGGGAAARLHRCGGCPTQEVHA